MHLFERQEAESTTDQINILVKHSLTSTSNISREGTGSMETLDIVDFHLDRYNKRAVMWARLIFAVLGAGLLIAIIPTHYDINWPSNTILQFLVLVFGTVGVFIVSLNFMYRQLAAGIRESLVSEDVLRQHEEQARKAREEADKLKNDSRSLETIGRLAGGVAHDFNNSLVVLLGCIDLMRSTDDSSTRQELLADMESAARGAHSTASQLLALSTEGAAPGQPSDPRSALRSIASNLRRMFPENITVRDMLRGTPAVTLVSGQFEQIILNLCLNARDAMPDGGALIIRCYKNPVEDEVIIEIEDSAAEEVTLRSGRSHRVQSLKMLEDVIQGIGGSIDTRTLGETGNCVTLRLPIAEKTEAEVVARPAENVKEKHVLLLDDDELVLNMLHRHLEMSGYQVSSASSVLQALTLLDANINIDILVSDAFLSDGTASAVVQGFREKYNGPVLICSGYGLQDPILAELNVDESLFLQKPFSGSALIAKLHDQVSRFDQAVH